MKTLVIDSATEACSAALFEEGTLVAGSFEIIGRGHAERLVPMIAALPGFGKADLVAVSTGPGSFTGVRVGIAAARALALVWSAELCGFPTLALLAAMARRDAGAGAGAAPVAIVTTGGHGEWFVQRFAADGTALAGAASLRPDEAVRMCPDDLVAGNKAQALVRMRGHGRALDILPDARDFTLLDPACLVAAATPLYVRAPDARLPVAPQ